MYRVKIANLDKFQRELEWFNELKKAGGPYNEEIISFCDRWHLADSKIVSNDVVKITAERFVKWIEDFGLIAVNKEDFLASIFMKFTVNKPNYYSIKEALLETVGDAAKQLDDFNSRKVKEAACVLIVTNSANVLMVTRKEDQTKFGLPGGKVDMYETPIKAATRELFTPSLKFGSIPNIFKRVFF